MRTSSTSTGLLFLLASAASCGGPSHADLSARLLSLTRDTVVVEATTTPGVEVVAKGSNVGAVAGSDGVARLEIPTAQATDPARPVIVFELRSSSMLGGSTVVGSGELDIGTTGYTLSTTLPADDGSSWVRGLGTSPKGPVDRCIWIRDADRMSDRMFDADVNGSGLRLVGPPGTVVTLDTLRLELPDTGVLLWDPSGADLLKVAGVAIDGAVLEATVESPGRPLSTRPVRLGLGRACARRIAAVVREGAAWSPQDPVPGALLVRANGEILPVWPKGAGALPDAHYRQLSHLALESTNRTTPATEPCTPTQDQLVFVGGDRDGQLVEKTRLTPEYADTKVTLQGPAGASVDKAFAVEVGKMDECEPLILPPRLAVEAWVQDQLPR